MSKNSGSILKAAVFGTGKMGLNHLKTIELLENARLVAVADPKPDKVKIQAAVKCSPAVYTDPEKLLSEVKPDIVHIVTPPETHVDLAMLAMDHGASVYIEKPFTLKGSDARRIIEHAGKKGVKVCAGHQLLFQQCTVEAKKVISQIGRIVHLESYFSFRTVRRNITPAGQIADILPHPLYLLLHFMELAQPEGVKTRPAIKSFEVGHEGDVRALIRHEALTGVLIVTLTGRPVESYLRLIGTNGSIHIDLIRGTVVKLAGPGDNAIPIILNPYFQSLQMLYLTTKAFTNMALKGQKGYPGLYELFSAFYGSVAEGSAPPVTGDSIIETVEICEAVLDKLDKEEAQQEENAKGLLNRLEAELPSISKNAGAIAVTGGTGFLGKAVAEELRRSGWPVRVISRSLPPYLKRLPGVEYVRADLSDSIPHGTLANVEAVVHCAAETRGGMEDHEKNSVQAIRTIIDGLSEAGIKKLIHISSIAVLKRKGPGKLDESAEVDAGNAARGPYIWGKAESEVLAIKLCSERGIAVKVIRAGPLVDFKDLKPPGRLGREVGPFFVAVGPKRSRISLCDVHTAAKVITSFMDDFNSAPAVLNLVEPTPPTRKELLDKILSTRGYLRALWIPYGLIASVSFALKLLLRMFRPGKKPIDIASAFASEEYNTSLAEKVIRRAQMQNPTIRP